VASSRAGFVALVALGVQIGCAATLRPGPAPPLSPDRFQHAADPDPAVRALAADELAGDPAAQAVEVLLALEQRDVDATVRAHAADAIADRGDPAFLDPLGNSAAVDRDAAVRSSAQQARQRLWRSTRDPHTAAALSALCPGCGQFYLHNTSAGVAQLAASVALIGGGELLVGDDPVNVDHPAGSAKAAVGFAMASVGQDLWFYSIFDAYRAARVLRNDAGYRHPITRETLPDLATAPFRPSVLARPWVWAGVPLTLGTALGLTYLLDRDSFSGRRSIFDIRSINILGHNFDSRAGAFAAGEAYWAVLFDPVGVGEESLFRGYLQTELEEKLGTYGGLASASAVFGAFHLFNFIGPGQDIKQAAFAVPVIATLGASFGLAYIQTGHRLETSVAMHFWYDFLLSTVGFAIDPENQPFVVQFSMPM
jgi:membrane protease YdiL (CAAX protease family)